MDETFLRLRTALNRDPDVTLIQIAKGFDLHITMCCCRTITTEDILPNDV